MTERRRRRPHPRIVIAGTLASFLSVLALLSFQLRAGLDPALGAGRATAALTASSQGTRVVTRASGSTTPSAQHSTAHHTTAPVVTRASGSGGGGDE